MSELPKRTQSKPKIYKSRKNSISKQTKSPSTQNTQAAVKPNLHPVLKVQDLWVQDFNGNRVSKIERGQYFKVAASFDLQLQKKFSTPILPVELNLDFVHVNLEEIDTLRGENLVEHAHIKKTRNSLGQFTIEKQYAFLNKNHGGGSTKPVGNPALGDLFGSTNDGSQSNGGGVNIETGVPWGGARRLHMFQIVADIESLCECAYTTISPWVYLIEI